MLRINMSQQYAKIELDVQDASLQLHTELPQLTMESEAATVDIHTEKGKLLLDMTPCRASYGFLNSMDFMASFAAAGKSGALEGIGRIAEEGDRMMRIESHEDAIVNIAVEKMQPPDMDIEWNFVDPPRVDYQPAEVRYEPHRGHLDIRVTPGHVENNSEPGVVKTVLAQRNSLDIWMTGSRDFRA